VAASRNAFHGKNQGSQYRAGNKLVNDVINECRHIAQSLVDDGLVGSTLVIFFLNDVGALQTLVLSLDPSKIPHLLGLKAKPAKSEQLFWKLSNPRSSMGKLKSDLEPLLQKPSSLQIPLTSENWYALQKAKEKVSDFQHILDLPTKAHSVCLVNRNKVKGKLESDAIVFTKGVPQAPGLGITVEKPDDLRSMMGSPVTCNAIDASPRSNLISKSSVAQLQLPRDMVDGGTLSASNRCVLVVIRRKMGNPCEVTMFKRMMGSGIPIDVAAMFGDEMTPEVAGALAARVVFSRQVETEGYTPSMCSTCSRTTAGTKYSCTRTSTQHSMSGSHVRMMRIFLRTRLASRFTNSLRRRSCEATCGSGSSATASWALPSANARERRS